MYSANKVFDETGTEYKMFSNFTPTPHD